MFATVIELLRESAGMFATGKKSVQIEIGRQKLGKLILHARIELESHVGAILGDIDHTTEECLSQPIAMDLDHAAERRRNRRLEPCTLGRDVADQAHPGPALILQLRRYPAGKAAMAPLFRWVFRIPRHSTSQIRSGANAVTG